MHKLRIKKFKSKYDAHKYKKIYFVIMGNIFNTVLEIHKRYDIKGSLYKRFIFPSADSSIARKDLNAINDKLKIYLKKEDASKFLA